jgi:hypothetical protein
VCCNTQAEKIVAILVGMEGFVVVVVLIRSGGGGCGGGCGGGDYK